MWMRRAYCDAEVIEEVVFFNMCNGSRSQISVTHAERRPRAGGVSRFI